DGAAPAVPGDGPPSDGGVDEKGPALAVDASGQNTSRDATADTTLDPTRDATVPLDGPRGDGAVIDSALPPANADASADGGCPAGLTRCATGCVSLAAPANCGACGHTCNLGSCSGSTCGPYVIAKQPTIGTVAKLATDGARVFWSDTGIVAIEQIGASGGNAISLASASATNGAVSSELALAGNTVAFAYLGVGAPSLGLATVDVAGSGASVRQGALSVNAISLNASATHVFYVDVTGTQGSLNDCVVSGREAGACVGVAGSGRFLAQTAADDAHLFFDLTGSGTSMQAGLYIDDLATSTANIFSTAAAQSVAVDGTWAYWSELDDGGPTYVLRRTLEAAPGTVVQTVTGAMASPAFATDGANAYYWTGTAIVSKPVAGGAETTLAPFTQLVHVAVGGGLLVWTDGVTIWGLAR
ncbi:MAG: hypothetical protein M3O36_15625, partial [Myxococcota bacterium]|nr:hypothetical protein [Myxococcota bacterium]